MNRLGFLHTSPAHISVFDVLLSELTPPRTALHVVDEELLADARTHGPDFVAERVTRRLMELQRQGAEHICCTCSTIGEIAEGIDIGIPVLRVDRPMATLAIALGPRIGVVAALASTIQPTRDLLEAAAAVNGSTPFITTVTADAAWPLFERGDRTGYLDEVATAARSLAREVDVIVLAQASMAEAEAELADLGIPVLSSPRLAVERLFH